MADRQPDNEGIPAPVESPEHSKFFLSVGIMVYILSNQLLCCCITIHLNLKLTYFLISITLVFNIDNPRPCQIVLPNNPRQFQFLELNFSCFTQLTEIKEVSIQSLA
jgi:hypothetical protein